MDLSNLITLILILIGAFVIGGSAILTRKIFRLLDNQKILSYWKRLFFLILFFLLGYFGAAYVVVSGNSDLLKVLAGVIFFFGSFFVFLVVRLGLTTLKELRDINLSLQDTVKERTKKLETMNRELQQFAHIASHDLKAPLRGIVALAHFIEEDLKGGEEQQVFSNIELLKSRVGQMENLIEGILEYSKVEQTSSLEEKIDMNVLINDIFDLLRVDSFEFKIKTPLPVITGVKSLMTQLFSNIISNAIKYGDKEQGLVEVDYVFSTEHEFSIKDNGPGIPEMYQKKIFEAFQTLQSKNSYESTGIGLTIVKKITNKLKGSIRVESSVGKGAKFILSFP